MHHRRSRAYTVLRQATRLVVRVLYRLDVRHPERFPAPGPVIVVANHESVLDPFVLGCAVDHLGTRDDLSSGATGTITQ